MYLRTTSVDNINDLNKLISIDFYEGHGYLRVSNIIIQYINHDGSFVRTLKMPTDKNSEEGVKYYTEKQISKTNVLIKNN